MSTAVCDVATTIRDVAEAVEKIKNDAPQNFPVAATVGDAVRQGDIYIQKIDDLTETPKFFKKLNAPAFPYQLAPGNTKGSRHCIEESAGLELYVAETSEFLDADTGLMDRDSMIVFQQRIRAYACSMCGVPEDTFWQSDKARVIVDEITETMNFSGPIMKVAGTATISHPEHGDWILPSGTYRVVFQRTLNSTDQVRRVLD